MKQDVGSGSQVTKKNKKGNCFHFHPHDYGLFFYHMPLLNTVESYVSIALICKSLRMRSL